MAMQKAMSWQFFFSCFFLGVLSLGCRSSVALKVQPEWKAQAHKKIRLQQNNAHCRRSVLLEGLMLCGIVAGSGSKPIEAAVLKSGAEAELNPGLTQEKISKVASKIPGYGPSDCYYPAFFKGLWEVEREIVGVNTPLGLDKVESPSVLQAASAFLNVKVQYQTRYIARGGDGSLVADRAFTARSLGRAVAPATFRDASWEPENPNILSSTYSDGVVKEVKVTKRSFETPSPETFGTSEYARVAEASIAGALGSVPQLLAQRTLTRYKRSEDGASIEALELLKYYPVNTGMSVPDGEPYLVVKSRLRLARPSSAAAATTKQQ